MSTFCCPDCGHSVQRIRFIEKREYSVVAKRDSETGDYEVKHILERTSDGYKCPECGHMEISTEPFLSDQ